MIPNDLFDDIDIAPPDEVEEANRYHDSILLLPQPNTPPIASGAANGRNSNTEPILHAMTNPNIPIAPEDALNPQDDSSDPFVLARETLRRTEDVHNSSHQSDIDSSSSSVSAVSLRPSIAAHHVGPYLSTDDGYIDGDNLLGLGSGFPLGDMPVEIAQVNSDVLPSVPDFFNKTTFSDISAGVNLVEETQHLQWPNGTFASDANISEVQNLFPATINPAALPSYVDIDIEPVSQFFENDIIFPHISIAAPPETSVKDATVLLDNQMFDMNFDISVPKIVGMDSQEPCNHIAQNTEPLLLAHPLQTSSSETLGYQDTRSSSLTVNNHLDLFGSTSVGLNTPIFQCQIENDNLVYREGVGPLTPKTAAFLNDLENAWPNGIHQSSSDVEMAAEGPNEQPLQESVPSDLGNAWPRGIYQTIPDVEVADESRFTVLDEAPNEQPVQQIQETNPILAANLTEVEHNPNNQVNSKGRRIRAQRAYQSTFRVTIKKGSQVTSADISEGPAPKVKRYSFKS